MPTIVERDSGSSSAMTMVVAIVALAIIVGFALYMLRLFPFAASQPSNGTLDVNVELPTGSAPSGN